MSGVSCCIPLKKRVRGLPLDPLLLQSIANTPDFLSVEEFNLRAKIWLELLEFDLASKHEEQHGKGKLDMAPPNPGEATTAE